METNSNRSEDFIKSCYLINDELESGVVILPLDANGRRIKSEKIIDTLYKSLISTSIPDDCSVYHYPMGNITRESWSTIKENTKIKKVKSPESADYIIVGIRSFGKFFSDANYYHQLVDSSIFCENVDNIIADFDDSLDNICTNDIKDSVKTKRNEIVSKLNALKVSASARDYVFRNGYLQNYFRYHHHVDLNNIVRALADMALQRSQKDENQSFAFVNPTYLDDLQTIIDNPGKTVSEAAILDHIKSHQVTIDADMYANLNSMLKSVDKDNARLAVDILSSVDVESSFGYVCLLMYQHMNMFTNNRDWFTNSRAKSMLLAFNNRVADAVANDKVVWGFDRGCNLPSRLEQPETLLKILTRTGSANEHIMSIIMDMVRKDFTDYIKTSWIERVLRTDVLIDAITFRPEFTLGGGE